MVHIACMYVGGGIVGKSNIGRVPDNDNSGIGIFAIIHGCIFFFLLALPFLFYCVCITTTKETLTQTTIKSDDQTAACFLPCCNCLLLSIVAGGMFAYFGFGIFSLSDMFQYGGAYATSMGVITVFVLMFNLVVGVEATILLGGMLPDSCQLCCKAHRDYS